MGIAVASIGGAGTYDGTFCWHYRGIAGVDRQYPNCWGLLLL
ncbi:MAG: hypothetical protein WBN08_16760 [Thiogranum sp.]